MASDGGLRPLFRRHLPQVHWTSVETGGTGLGVPDSHGCYQGAAFWVEFKQTDGWAIGSFRERPEQVGWLCSYARRGGLCWVAVRRRCPAGPRRGPAVDELWLYPGEAAGELRREGLKTGRPPTGRWAGGPSGWDWDEVLSLLTRRLPPAPPSP